MTRKNAFSQAFNELISMGAAQNPNAAEDEAKLEPSESAETASERVPTPYVTDNRISPRVLSGGKTTIIAAGTTVEGNLHVEGSAEVDGCLRGDIECTGCLTVSGEIVGGSRTSEMDVIGARIEGNIESKGSVFVRNGAVVIGNINGQSMQISGAVKGTIVLPGHLTLGSTAVILGDIRAGSLDIQNGAVIDGHVAIQSSGRVGDVFSTEKRSRPTSDN